MAGDTKMNTQTAEYVQDAERFTAPLRGDSDINLALLDIS